MGNILRHGIEMYKKTMNQTLDSAPKEEQAKPPQNAVQGNIIRPIGNYKNDHPIFFKETNNFKTAVPKKEKTSADSKYRRVAKFLILIGSKQAAGVLAELDSQQITEISKEIASIKKIQSEERDEILTEFNALFSGPYRFLKTSQGGIETARRILYAAKGPDKGEMLLNKAVPATKENMFSFLEEYSIEQLVLLFKEESPQTAALILSRMPPKLSAGILSRLQPDRKAGILLRMAHQKEVLPEVLEQVSAALKEKVRNVGGGANDIKIDGMQTLAAILKHGDYQFGDRIIGEIEEENPKIGHDLKEKLYTLDDVINTVDRHIQEKLKTMTEYDIAVLLKGRNSDFNEKILSCVSAGRRKLIREESDILGAVPKRESDLAAKEFLAWFRLARENSEILLYTDEDVFE
ncbi:MAG: flagellar motor switch protein FliG [Treponema sp.]|nr:flagellar motor switch protein FliG [Treponema sp.]